MIVIRPLFADITCNAASSVFFHDPACSIYQDRMLVISNIKRHRRWWFWCRHEVRGNAVHIRWLILMRPVSRTAQPVHEHCHRRWSADRRASPGTVDNLALLPLVMSHISRVSIRPRPLDF